MNATPQDRIEIRYSVNDYGKISAIASIFPTLRRPLRIIIPVLGVFGAISFLNTKSSYAESLATTMTFVVEYLILLLAIAVGIAIVSYFHARRVAARMGLAEQSSTMTLREDGLMTEGTSGQALIPWNELKWVDRCGRYLVISHQLKMRYVLSRNFFRDDESFVHWERTIREKIDQSFKSGSGPS